jgi:protein TonB
MTGRIVGIVLAIVAHLAVLLFGGLLFLKPPEKKEANPVEVVDLVSEESAEKDRRGKDPEKETPVEPLDEATEEPMELARERPDLRALATPDAAAAAPALDAMSLSALEDLLNPPAAGGGDPFAGGVDLASGGRIGGTGRPGAAAEAESIFSVADLDQTPRPIYQAPPTYPLELRRRKIEGSVYVLFVVDETGRVVNPRVERSTSPEFDAPALEAVRQWKFEPGSRNGQKVRFRMRVPLRFAVG